MAVPGDLAFVALREGRAKLGDLRVGLELRDRLADDRAERRVGGCARGRLHEHVLHLLVQLEAGVTDDVIGGASLADVHVVLVDRLHPDRPADHERGDHEREPAEDGRLAVLCAPTTHPGRDVGALLQAVTSLFSSESRCFVSRRLPPQRRPYSAAVRRLWGGVNRTFLAPQIRNPIAGISDRDESLKLEPTVPGEPPFNGLDPGACRREAKEPAGISVRALRQLRGDASREGSQGTVGSNFRGSRDPGSALADPDLRASAKTRAPRAHGDGRRRRRGDRASRRCS